MSNNDVLEALHEHVRGLTFPPSMQFGVTGSRGFSDVFTVSLALGTVGLLQPDAVMHNGNCKAGADALCLEVWPFMSAGNAYLHEPLFHIYGSPRAYHVRNESIVARADFLLAFDRGDTRGTASTIRFAEERGIPVFKFGQPV